MPTTTPHQATNPTPSEVDRQSHTQSDRNSRGAAVPELSELFSAIMGVQSSDGQVTFSSIALLQQRFRELERIREKREERLLHMLAPRPAATITPRETPVKWFFHPDLLYPCRPLRDTAAATASLFTAVPATCCECKSFQLRGEPIAVEVWPSKTYNYKHISGEVDIDTSLHL